jgi:hypothetical protein
MRLSIKRSIAARARLLHPTPTACSHTHPGALLNAGMASLWERRPGAMRLLIKHPIAARARLLHPTLTACSHTHPGALRNAGMASLWERRLGAMRARIHHRAGNWGRQGIAAACRRQGLALPL